MASLSNVNIAYFYVGQLFYPEPSPTIADIVFPITDLTIDIPQGYFPRCRLSPRHVALVFIIALPSFIGKSKCQLSLGFSLSIITASMGTSTCHQRPLTANTNQVSHPLADFQRPISSNNGELFHNFSLCPSHAIHFP